jgi:hypothetical protein
MWFHIFHRYRHLYDIATQEPHAHFVSISQSNEL